MANYVSASPDSGQWNAISTSGANKAWSVDSGAMVFSSTGNNAAFASRSTDFTTIPSVMGFTFTFHLLSSINALTTALEFSVGSGYGTANSQELNANIYAKFGINTTATNGFVVRDISGTTNGSTTFALGAFKISWYANNSSGDTTYLAPDGSTESLPVETWDLWVASSKQLNDRPAVTATQTIADFKFGSASSGNFSASFDDIVIQSIPEPKILALAGLAGLFLIWKLRLRARSAPGSAASQ